jgi:hypothetical protein
MVDIPTLITAVAGSSLIAGYLQLQVERRQGRMSRSDIVKALRQVELRRWAKDDDNTLEGFNSSARELEVTALVTGVRRDVTETYLAWAYVGGRRSFESMEERGDYDAGGGAIDSNLAIGIDKLARLVADSAWRPLYHKLFGKRDLKAIEEYLDTHVDERYQEWASQTPWRRHAR